MKISFNWKENGCRVRHRGFSRDEMVPKQAKYVGSMDGTQTIIESDQDPAAEAIGGKARL